MLIRLTQTDYDREIVLVAMQPEKTEEKMLGMAQLMSDPDGEKGDFP